MKQQRNKQIFHLIKGGYSISNIAKLMNLSLSKTWRIVRSNGELNKFRTRETIVDDDFLVEPLSPTECWFVGCMAGDGNVYKNHISIVSTDFDIIQKFKNLSQIGNITIRRHLKYKTRYTWSIDNAILVERLKKFNIIPNKTFILKFADDIPNNLISHYIRGILDSDGSIGFMNNAPYISFVSASKEFLSSLLNITNDITKSNVKLTFDKRRNGIWQLLYTRRNALSLTNWIYNDSNNYNRMDRKYDKAIGIINYYKTVDNNIELKKLKRYDLAVEIFSEYQCGSSVKTLQKIHNKSRDQIYDLLNLVKLCH